MLCRAPGWRCRRRRELRQKSGTKAVHPDDGSCSIDVMEKWHAQDMSPVRRLTEPVLFEREDDARTRRPQAKVCDDPAQKPHRLLFAIRLPSTAQRPRC